MLATLRLWQSQRLAHTHADLLESPRYGPACRFFLSDIYAPHDFSQRDQDFEHIYELMSRFLPDFLLSLARKAIQMNRLTSELDQALLDVLVDQLGIKDRISPDIYAEAYRLCDNYDKRLQQIELVVEVGRQVELATRIPLVGMTLRLARRPAKRAGWDELHGFFEKGYNAFKDMRGAGPFLSAIRKRELAILDNIYQNDPDPFSI
jgi:hypothetical protein